MTPNENVAGKSTLSQCGNRHDCEQSEFSATKRDAKQRWNLHMYRQQSRRRWGEQPTEFGYQM